MGLWDCVRICDAKGYFCQSRKKWIFPPNSVQWQAYFSCPFQVLSRSQKLGEEWIANGRKRWMLERGCAEEYRGVNHRLGGSRTFFQLKATLIVQ